MKANSRAIVGNALAAARTPIGVGAAIAAALLIVTAVVASTGAGARWSGDLELYFQYSGIFLDGRLSQTPFLAWYPPLSLVPLTLPHLLSASLPAYSFLFALEMSILAGAGVLLVPPIASRLGRSAATSHPVAAYAVFVLLCAFVLPLRFDAVPAVISLAAVGAGLTGQPFLAGALLGAGAALKLFPAIFLPALVGWYWFGDRRSAAVSVAGFALAFGAGLGIYLLFPPASPLDLLRFQTQRGLQIESLPGSIIGFGASIGVVSQPGVVFQDGSYNLLGSGASVALQVLAIAEPVALMTAFAAFVVRLVRDWRNGDRSAQTPILGMAALVLALVLTNRVFSTQYVVWLLPVVAFLPRRLLWIALAAAALTTIMFPFAYAGVVDLQPGPTALVLARNLVLVGLFATLLARLLRPNRPLITPPVGAG